MNGFNFHTGIWEVKRKREHKVWHLKYAISLHNTIILPFVKKFTKTKKVNLNFLF